jgi:hypothetical protein
VVVVTGNVKNVIGINSEKKDGKKREITQKNNFFLHSGHIGEKRGSNFNK